MVDKKRRVADLLPGHLQTETVKKVFAATVDHMFQPESVEFLTGYIGSRPSWYDPTRDFYITEPTVSRTTYQLSPTIVSRDYQSGQITNALFYEDLLGQLRFQGALVNNPSRLFEQEYYSWCPPIDIDKFVNFGNYYWLPLGPDSIELLETTNLMDDAVGSDNYTYNGNIRYSSTGEIAYVNLKFTSGLKIKPLLDRNQSLNNKDFFIEMVGRGIRLISSADISNPGWDSIPWDVVSWDGTSSISEKKYILINRSSNDGNQWSIDNRWFHSDVIEISKTSSSDRYTQQARRPIIEFDPDLRLFDYGYTDRGNIDLIDNENSDFLGSIVGKSSYSIDNVFIRDGMRILPVADSNPSVKNKIYVVSGQSAGAIILTHEPNGGNADGDPVRGDRAAIRFGSYQSSNIWYDGTKWKFGQQVGKNLSNGLYVTWPLFDLFDVDGIEMSDPSVYPGSNFSGSFVFSYGIDITQNRDSELGFNTRLDQFGDYVFSNDLSKEVVSYVSDNKQTEYVGDLFVSQDDVFVGSWNKSQNTSRQYIINEFLITDTSARLVIDQVPAENTPNTLPTLMVYMITPEGMERNLTNNVDYTISGKTITLIAVPSIGTRIIIKSWNPLPTNSLTGYYELPKNLTANPNNDDITDVARSQFLQHFVQIIGNQTNLTGNVLGINNYRDSAQVKGLGLSILQHRAPMLKLGLMNTVPLNDVTVTTGPTDPIEAMQWAQRSYQRFYNKFLQTLFLLAKKQGYNAGSSVTACDPYILRQWITSALQQINIGKTQNSPWANSGPSQIPGSYCSIQSTSPTYVPASPTRIGITPAYKPVVYMDTTYGTPRLVIQTHDGSRIVMVNQDGEQLGTFLHGQSETTNPEELTDPVAGAWLMFENDLYNNLPEPYRDPESIPVFDVRQVVPGKWRTTDYTRDEVLSIERNSFDKWAVSNQIDYRANTTYFTEDPFTYNYRSVTDLQGMPIPGYWQGIYKWFYDTDRPHTHPWEMLGFSQKPIWWDLQYGQAPYTRGNTAMWEDLRDGIIRQGQRAGSYLAWTRPGLMSCIPVDDQGNLLPPVLAGCAAYLPDVYSSSDEWRFGDGSPIESTWRNSQDCTFVQSQLGYLLKPARFVEQTWDILRTKNAFSLDELNNQWIYIDTNSRRGSNQFYVHREQPISLTTGVFVPNESNLSYFGSCGFQHWISEYLISQGLDVTRYFGNIIRGGNVQLAHRMAGYINAESLRATVDSFGELGYTSSIIPGENINTYLYRSTSIEENSYSGVVVEQVKNGWRVFGYDKVSQKFTIIPSNINGSKTSIVIGSQRVVEYQQGLKTISYVSYGTTFSTRQDLYDFLISYGRYLESTGWIFDQYSENANAILDWKQSAKEFLFWSQGNWNNGNFIALSPLADSATFKQDFGNIQYVNGTISGGYPVVDRSGLPIQPQNSSIFRNEGVITIKPINSQGIFGLKLYSTTLEHAIFFDNITSFNDVIYQPLYDLKQERIKIYAYRANDWNGRVDAPGYFLTRNENTGNWSMVSNFDSTVTDIQKYFNIEQPKNYTEIGPTGTVVQKQTAIGSSDRDEISNIARHLIGYQPRTYMENLLLEETTQYEFYQGFIKQKGTRSTIDSLLRNTSIIPVNSTFEYYEEWLIRLGWYGATSLNNIIEFRLPQDRVVNRPQWIRLFSTGDSDYQGDDVLDIVPFDPLIVVPPESYQEKLFSLRNSYGVDPATDIPTAGYVMLGETDWTVANTSALLDLYTTQKQTTSPLKNRDTIWQFVTDTGSWNAWMLVRAVGQIEQTVPSTITGAPTLIATVTEHGLIDGDICIIYGVSGVAIIDGTYVVSGVTPKTFNIPISTYEAGVGGTILVYRPLRFKNIFERDSNEVPGGWEEGDLCYVDEGGITAGAWTVYKFVESAWLPYRQQEYRVAANLLKASKLYDSENKNELSLMNYFDPIQGRISARADAEINYKTDYDPAKYNKGNATGYALSESEAWDSAQLGMTWWDLSATRYIDYGQGDERYRIQHWGKIAPGTSIDVYEWIRSPIPPSDWSSYVAEGKSISDGNRTYIPSGSIRNASNPSWSEVTEIIPGGFSKIYYYFWVKNSAMAPSSTSRKLTTANIANLIKDPSYDDKPWYAAISSRSIIVGNISNLLNGNRTVQKISYATSPNEVNIYGEWELIREGDKNSPISDSVWNKLKSSLVTFDGLGNDVPDYHLPEIQRYGSTIRPRQTWFIDRVAASKVFVDSFNELIATNPTPMVDDPSMMGWQTFFNAGEPVPEQSGNWNYRVPDLQSRDSLIGAIIPGQVVLVDPTPATDNRWVMYVYLDDDDPWLPVREQAYNTANYWGYVDWYFTGYDANTEISYSVETLSDLDLILSQRIGQVARVANNGANKWQLYTWTGEWRLVGQQDGNILVFDSVYDWKTSIGGFDSVPFDSEMFDATAAIELANIIDGIKNAIYSSSDSIQVNTLLFSMISYVLSEQTQVDWLIKTSDIVLKGFNQSLTPSPILLVDNVDNIIGFVEEAKPYHAKVREFITGKSSTDISQISVIDFDVPQSYLTEGTPGIPPVFPDQIESQVNDVQNRSYYQTYKSWYDNYIPAGLGISQSFKNPNLIRNLTTTLIFDRISTEYYRQGWGVVWDDYGWDNTANQTFGALERIEKFYSPTEGMIPKIIEDLMGGISYKGAVLNGIGFNVGEGWSVGQWDTLVGWDPLPGSISIDSYLDQVVQGGALPMYDYGIGTGIKKIFPLTQDVYNPHSIIAWSDGKIRVYGAEWIIRTYAQSVEIVDGGVGYLVGDKLDLIAGTGLAATKLEVTSINPINGAITGISIIGKGSYTVVLPGPYHVEYPLAYPGGGNDAVVSINWSCADIEFFTPPASSDRPNVYVLYIGKTFGAAPTGDSDTIYEGNDFVQPHVDDNHPEELYVYSPKDSVILDVRTEFSGGAPIVSSKVYVTDGITDQYPLMMQPQSADGVKVYLDGNLLKFGLSEDYVINMTTGKIVFLSPPSSGKTLYIIGYSPGGSSRLIKSVKTVIPGSGYVPGDVVTLFVQIGMTPTLVRVDNTKVVGFTITDQGLGYKIGDQITLSETNGGAVYQGLKTSWRVTSVSDVGAVTGISLEFPGSWSAIPTSNVFEIDRQVSGAFSPLAMDIEWGVDDSSVLTPGRYYRIPSDPLTQEFAPVSGGSGAFWNLEFFGDFETYYFTGDGSNTDFYMPNVDGFITGQFLITVNGVITYPSMMLSGGIRLPSPPPYGSTVIITVFNNTEYSRIIETSITVTNSAVLDYTLIETPDSTRPVYISTIVLKNGDLVAPPLIEMFRGDGVTSAFRITIDISSSSSIDVFVDGISIGTSYTIESGNMLIIPFVPMLNSDILLLAYKSSDAYRISGNTITFSPGSISNGDEISVSTFNQDLDYEFHTEMFDTESTNSYSISKTPWSFASICVWLDGKQLVPSKDFMIMSPRDDTGWNTIGWDQQPWNTDATGELIIYIPDSYTTGSKVVIRYMMGLPHKNETRWRTLSYQNTSISTAMDLERSTVVLSNVYVRSTSIEIADITTLSTPEDGIPSNIYINDELIGFYTVRHAPTTEYPNRAFLEGLQRNKMGTSGNPRDRYNVLFYDGDGANIYFATEAAGQAIATSVFVNGTLMQEGTDYELVINPSPLIGEFVKFTDPPGSGYRNVKIAAFNVDSINERVSHVALSNVYDAGKNVTLPNGGYNWEPANDGSQYNRTRQARFLLKHHSD